MRSQPAVVVASAALLVAVAALAAVLITDAADGVREDADGSAAEVRTVSGAAARMGHWLEWLNAPDRDDALLAHCIESEEDMLDCGLRHIGSLENITRMAGEVRDAGASIMLSAAYECFPEVPAFRTLARTERCLDEHLNGGRQERQQATGPRSARPYLSRIRGGLGSPMESILSQMPDGMIPSRDRRGEDRILTYTFGDGSEMILAFRPRGGQTGLELYMVDVRD